MVLPATERRVPEQTSERINQRIDREIRIRVHYYAQHPDRIDARLRELEQEWDIERALEANASALAFTGTALGLLASRRWLILPLMVTGFLFQHALQGWCPPMPLLRRCGVRTAGEIHRERVALKAIRGDFDDLGQGETRPDQAIEAARA